MSEVLLKCVKEGSKLRVKIVSSGYFNDSNCQFPRDLRAEGRMYKVPPESITLASSKNGNYFYRVKKGQIEVVNLVDPEVLKKMTVFEDASLSECAICFEAPKDTVIVPCGHFYTCKPCSSKLQRCPICRGGITSIIDKSQMD